MTDCPAENVSSTLVIYADFGGGGGKNLQKKAIFAQNPAQRPSLFFLDFHSGWYWQHFCAK